MAKIAEFMKCFITYAQQGFGRETQYGSYGSIFEFGILTSDRKKFDLPDEWTLCQVIVYLNILKQPTRVNVATADGNHLLFMSFPLAVIRKAGA